MRIGFSHEYGKIEGYIYYVENPEEAGVNLYLTPAILDQLQQEILDNGGKLSNYNICGHKV